MNDIVKDPANNPSEGSENNNPESADKGTNKEGNALTPYRPEGLPDHFYGKSEKDVIDNLFKAYKGSREELSKAGKQAVPDKIDDYKLELPEDLAKSILVLDADGKDHIFESMRGVFHKNGIPADKAIDVILELNRLNTERNKKIAEEIPPADFDFKEMGGLDKAKPIIEAVTANLNGLLSTKKLNESEVEELKYLTAHSGGLGALKKLLELTGEKIIPKSMDAGHSGSEITEAVLNARVADKRYQAGTKHFDIEFYEQTTKMFEEFYKEENVA